MPKKGKSDSEIIRDENESRVKDTIKTTKGLRDTLFQEIDAVRKDESTPARGRTVATLASAILSSVKLDIEAFKYLSAGKGRDFATQRKLPDLEL